MENKTWRKAMIALVLIVASVTLIVSMQIVSAQSFTPAGSRQAQNLGSRDSASRELPDPNLPPASPVRSAGTVLAGGNSGASLSSALESVPGVRFVHRATAGNTVTNSTYIDHRLTNNNPNAILFVMPNNMSGFTSYGMNYSVGVRYSHGAGKWTIFKQYYTDTMAIHSSFNVLIPDPGPNVFLHWATLLNTVGAYTVIDHPLTNDNPDALLFVTQNWNALGLGGVYNDNVIGVFYSTYYDKWCIRNQDLTTSMPIGAAFNILVPNSTSNTFVHETTAGNVAANRTYIDHPLTNDNPNALVYVTISSLGLGGRHDRSIWVSYNHGAGKWIIANVEIANMCIGCVFNVLVPVDDTQAIVHRATTENSYMNSTYVDNPLTNDEPDNIAFVTQNWNPCGVGDTYNDHSIGVWYSTIEDKSAIFNQFTTNTMPISASFNILIPNVDAGVFVHRATPGDIIGHQTFIDYPLTNNDPDAILFVTHNWNPGGVGGPYNDHNIAVQYADGRGEWGIMNQDFASIPISATFNVLAPITAANVFVHQATAGNILWNWTYIDHPLTNNNPCAHVFVTQNWNPGGGFGIYNDHSIGVWYSSSAEKWAIFNQDEASMPEGASFSVLVVPPDSVYLPLVVR